MHSRYIMLALNLIVRATIMYFVMFTMIDGLSLRDPELRVLCDQIIKSQREEIPQMKLLLKPY